MSKKEKELTKSEISDKISDIENFGDLSENNSGLLGRINDLFQQSQSKDINSEDFRKEFDSLFKASTGNSDFVKLLISIFNIFFKKDGIRVDSNGDVSKESDFEKEDIPIISDGYFDHSNKQNQKVFNDVSDDLELIRHDLKKDKKKQKESDIGDTVYDILDVVPETTRAVSDMMSLAVPNTSVFTSACGHLKHGVKYFKGADELIKYAPGVLGKTTEVTSDIASGAASVISEGGSAFSVFGKVCEGALSLLGGMLDGL